MEVKNDIVVKFSLWNSEVKYEQLCGSIVLYNHNNLYKGEDKNLIFTGVKLEHTNKARMICESPPLSRGVLSV